MHGRSLAGAVGSMTRATRIKSRLAQGLGGPTLRIPEVRSLYVAYTVLGVAASTALPLIPLFLTEELRASGNDIGLFMSTRLISPVLVVATGVLARRMRSSRPVLLAAALWTSVGWFMMATVHGLAQAMVVSLVFFGLSGVLNAQFAVLLHDVVEHAAEQQSVAAMTTLRGGFALGTAIGPLLGTAVIATVGFRANCVVAAALFALGTLPLFRVKATRPVASSAKTSGGTGNADAQHRQGEERGLGAQGYGPFGLAVMVTGIALVMSCSSVKTAYLPLQVVDGLHSSTTVLGVLLALGTVVEVIAFPVMGALAERLGIPRVLWASLLAGAAGYALMAVAGDLWVLVVVQFLHAASTVGVFGISVSYVLERSRTDAHAAHSAFFAAQGISTPVGGLLGSFAFVAYGIPDLFWVPAAIYVAFLLVLTVEARAGLLARPT
ncbi:MFS transporter [Streptomyces tendae]|uniref:MFS transporter n=1 Tax=Streptomyces tendae TaxID=1932 RepID=UPI0036556A66